MGRFGVPANFLEGSGNQGLGDWSRSDFRLYHVCNTTSIEFTTNSFPSSARLKFVTLVDAEANVAAASGVLSMACMACMCIASRSCKFGRSRFTLYVGSMHKDILFTNCCA